VTTLFLNFSDVRASMQKGHMVKKARQLWKSAFLAEEIRNIPLLCFSMKCMILGKSKIAGWFGSSGQLLPLGR
jgi:hypothetical protein